MCFQPDSVPAITPVAGAAVDSEDLRLTAADGTDFAAFVARAENPSGAGMVVLPDVRGLYKFYEELALRFAEVGINAIAFDYFGRTAGVDKRDDDFPFMEHVMKTTDQGVSDDVAASVAYLRSSAGGSCGSIFTVGFCFGGSNSWLQATKGHNLSGAIGFYGRPGPGFTGAPAPIDLAKDMTCPILALMGGSDDGIPAADIESLRAALEAAPGDHEVVVYEKATHSFFDRRYEEFADESADAWKRSLAFVAANSQDTSMATVDSSGWQLNYETLGDPADPSILLVLGLSHRLAHWGKLPALLAKSMFVVTFDCRGIGGSEKRDEPFTVRDEVGDMAVVLDAAAVERAVIYGRSRGGMLAQEFALTHPERTKALVLAGTNHRGPSVVPQTERVARTMSIQPGMSREEIFRGQNEAMASPQWEARDPEAFNYCLSVDLEAPPRRFAVIRQQGALEGWSKHDRIAAIDCPTLVLHGEDDGMVPPENGRQLAAAIPNARLQLISQCGHLPMLEKPQEVADSVLQFADKLD